jgi:hypothetical protein
VAIRIPNKPISGLFPNIRRKSNPQTMKNGKMGERRRRAPIANPIIEERKKEKIGER